MRQHFSPEQNIQRRIRTNRITARPVDPDYDNYNEETIDGEYPSSPETRRDHSDEIYRNVKQNETSGSSKLFYYIVIVLFIVSVWAIFYFKQEEKLGRKVCPFDDFKTRYPQQNELWKSLKVNIESILNNEPPTPSVYLLLHKNSSTDQKLIDAIAAKASSCFDPSLRPIRINFDSTSSDDYGHIIQEFKRKVRGGGTVIIKNLNHISGKSARALHAICDIESPMIRKVLILLTLASFKDSGHPTADAETVLNELWNSELKHNELDPLIARVTDQVFQFN